MNARMSSLVDMIRLKIERQEYNSSEAEHWYESGQSPNHPSRLGVWLHHSSGGPAFVADLQSARAVHDTVTALNRARPFEWAIIQQLHKEATL